MTRTLRVGSTRLTVLSLSHRLFRLTPTTTTPAAAALRHAQGFAHQALLYADEAEFVRSTAAFVREGVDLGESVMVAIADRKTSWLRDELGADNDTVDFVDMEELGRNPAAIIPAWYRFVDTQQRNGRAFRGIGEPIWVERTKEELIECERHEALLNLAFCDGPTWTLLCPYDVSALPPAVIVEAKKNHPELTDGNRVQPSPSYPGPAGFPVFFDHPLPPPPPERDQLPFGPSGLGPVRRFVRQQATRLGAVANRVDDFILAVSEVAANSIVHGGGGGWIGLWRHQGRVVCQVNDAGVIADPLAGRRPPAIDDVRGRGLWMANQLCDLVQVRNLATGSVVRLHVDAS